IAGVVIGSIIPDELPPGGIPAVVPLPPGSIPIAPPFPASLPVAPPSPPGHAFPEVQTHAPEASHLQALQPSSASLRSPALQFVTSQASLWQLHTLSEQVHWVQPSARVAVAPFLG